MSTHHVLLVGSETREGLRGATPVSDVTRCRFLDYRVDFVSILADKLGTVRSG
jgi:hypothetical protein